MSTRTRIARPALPGRLFRRARLVPLRLRRFRL